MLYGVVSCRMSSLENCESLESQECLENLKDLERQGRRTKLELRKSLV